MALTLALESSSSAGGEGGGGGSHHHGRPRERMFEKVVTPSDVGKLNRLVVPKQHAEKHFPLQLPAAEAVAGGECKGVLLNFEDGEGKVWRFRYSYWNSSQSYVLTRGWSRFVREKDLRAGDTVAFSQSVYGQENQLLINYRKMQREQEEAMADVIAVEARSSIKLFGVDIASGGREAGEWHGEFLER